MQEEQEVGAASKDGPGGAAAAVADGSDDGRKSRSVSGGGIAAIFQQNSNSGSGGGSMNKRQLVEISLYGSFKDCVSPGDAIAVVGILNKRKQDQGTKETRGTLIMTCQVWGLRVLKVSGSAMSVNHKVSQLVSRQQRELKKQQQQQQNDGSLIRTHSISGAAPSTHSRMTPNSAILVATRSSVTSVEGPQQAAEEAAAPPTATSSSNRSPS